MPDALAIVFNRTCDFSAVFSITVNCITITVIVKCTPKNMKNFAGFLLNIMIWNFIVNLIFVVARPYPLLPVVCFRLDGLISQLFDSELLGHILFGFILLVVVNVATAIFLSFQFRLMTIACGRYMQNVKSIWGYIYCGLLHISFSSIYLFMYQRWPVLMDNYHPKIPIEERANLFCFAPEGPCRNGLVYTVFVLILLIVFAVMLFVLTAFCHLRRNKAVIGKSTLKMQKFLLWNLITLSGIPITLGGVPFLTAVLTIIFHDSPFAQTTCAICMLILINYGPIMCIASICMFKTYRRAVTRVAFRLVGKEAPVSWTAGGVTMRTNIAAMKSEMTVLPTMRNNWIPK
uniref:G_PROTEIN_RECEP_F1_2 domain-containing protein n=1 Tax=Steinernema glaseri TaxID=37863 RepID=A0A1I7XYH2_9BILA